MGTRRTSLKWGLAQTLRIAGILLMAASAGGALISYAVLAAVEPASTHAAAAPTPTPTAAPRMIRGGPLSLSLSGSLQMGEAMQSQVRSDAGAGSQVVQSNTSATSSAGLLLRMERRTASTTLQFSVPAGISARIGRFGELQAGFYTPTYGVLFGSEPLSLLGGVPVGQTLRGFSLQLPLRGGGDVLFFSGPAIGANENLIHIAGVRARSRMRSAIVELGFDRASDKVGDSATNVVFGLAGQNAPGTLSQIFEGAWQHEHAAPGFAANGAAYAYRLDYGGSRAYTSLTLRHVPDGFLSVGNGAIAADDLISAAWHGGGTMQYSVSEALERTGAGQSLQSQRYGTLTLARQFHAASALLSLTDQRQDSAALGTQWQGQASMQLAIPFRSVDAIFGMQSTRSTGFSMPFSQITYSSQFQRMLGAGNVTAGYVWNRQMGTGGITASGLGNLSLTMPAGRRMNLTFSNNLTRTISPTSNAVQFMPLITVQRLFSPVLTLAVTYGLQTLHDRLNLAANGHSRVFQVQLAAPFAIGSGLVTGRADPNLPGTITGTVVQDEGAQETIVPSLPNGAGNVAVVLDNDQVQRTDLSGRFQFNFVNPGTHTLRLETASLPRGVTADQPYATISVGGGQTGQVNFRIGTYGAVAGHLYGLNPDGSTFPVAGASIVVDKNFHAVTDSYGAYGVGRLAAGSHAIAIDPGTLPANVSFGSDDQKTAIVSNGDVTTVDFLASHLGSIAGTIEYDPALGPPYTGGVNNAYVVAEPGEHAAIADPDGSFLIDNLPPGSYTVNVDPETLDDGLVAVGGPFAEPLEPGEHIEGVHFVVRKQMKAIVFSFKGGTSAPPPAQLVLRTKELPPGGATSVEFHAAAKAGAAQAVAFGRSTDLSYDARSGEWIGTISVPEGTKNGNYEVSAQLQGDLPLTASGRLSIDDAIPVATFVLTPRNPVPGQVATVRAHFVADVRAGDAIHWLDGQITKLAKPVAGRVFLFTVKISERPMTGELLSGAGKLPITLR